MASISPIPTSQFPPQDLGPSSQKTKRPEIQTPLDLLDDDDMEVEHPECKKRKASDSSSDSEQPKSRTARKGCDSDTEPTQASELLAKLGKLINRMSAFANQTKNVHCEIKNLTKSTAKTFKLYSEAKRSAEATHRINVTKPTTKTASTNTERKETNPQANEGWPKLNGCTITPNNGTQKISPLSNGNISAPSAGTFTTVSRKKPAKPDTKATSSSHNTTRKFTRKPAAVLVKVGVDKSYADTVRKIRGLDVDFDALGTRVTSMRKTAGGDLLVELTKSIKSSSAATILRDRIAEKINDTSVRCLGQSVNVEILDLDEVTTREEITEAILKAADLGLSDTDIKITGLWSTKSGRQMATASIPSSMVNKLTHIRIGWLQCRVRPRRAEPPRCFRCHGYGHDTRKCINPDLTGACRRCGVTGHVEKQCTAGDDRCVACERGGYTRKLHRPGSGSCEAKMAAVKAIAPSRK